MGGDWLAGASGGNGTTAEAGFSGRFDQDGIFDTDFLGV